MKLIGLSGYAGAGKDEAANILKEIGYERKAFADPLREFLYVMNPIIPTGSYYSPHLQDIVNMYGWQRLKQAPYKDGYRNLIQTVGTDCVRNILGENTWIHASFSTLEDNQDYVFSDCRFLNEAYAIINAGGKIIRIERESVSPALNHVSETDLDGFEFDEVIYNNGTLDDLRDSILKVEKELYK
jgi:hypothetical protein